jgi:hypothetical protein
MVLCRSPRGAVFARDAKAGCKFGARLTPANLVDFGGAGAGACALRASASAPDAANGDALCRAADASSRCVVGLTRGADGAWGTTGCETPIAQIGAGAQIACCRP